jgi:4-hydroxy-3-methylbut-2-enyl diphosphate reductase IspH
MGILANAMNAPIGCSGSALRLSASTHLPAVAEQEIGGRRSWSMLRLDCIAAPNSGDSKTFHLENWNGFDKEMPFSKNTAGITDGASIPDRVIGEFVKNLAALEYDSGYGKIFLEKGESEWA